MNKNALFYTAIVINTVGITLILIGILMKLHRRIVFKPHAYILGTIS